MSKNQIERSKIQIPKIRLTERACAQLQLIIENDFTLKNQKLRVLISGKECDGFTYSLGFTNKEADDFEVPFENAQNDFMKEVKVYIDPFSAHYIPEATIDFIQDFTQDAEGFVLINHQQKLHHGKFWVQSPDKIPPMAQEL